MGRIWLGIFVLGATAFAAAVGPGFAADEAGEKPSIRIDSPADAARKKALIADADAALKLLTAKKFHEFIETYGPVDDLRRIRAEDSFKEVAQSFVYQPERMTTLVKLLRGIKSGNITFQAHGSEATIELLDADAAGIAAGAAEKKSSGKKIAVPIAEPKGLGKELPEALKAASKLVEDENTSEFVASVYPVSMLTQLDLTGRRSAVVEQLHENEALRAALSRDLAALQKLKPELTDNGTVAVFKLKPAASDSDEDESKKPAKPGRERVIKFQLADGNWRFFDASAKVTETIEQLASAKAASAPPSIRMEKIGGNWRFITFEGLGF